MKSLTILAATILLMLAASCTAPDKPAAQVHEEMNSVYYWKTVFRLDKADRAFAMLVGDEARAKAQYMLGNMKTVVKRYGNTAAARKIKTSCDSWRSWL